MVFVATGIVFGSCFNPPELPIVPSIEFDKVEFVDAQSDSLILTIKFKDGDGDLGLDAENPLHRSYPYNDSYFYQENNGSLLQLPTYSLSSQMLDIIYTDDASRGKLVFARTKKKPAYANIMPPYDYPYYCTVYNHRKILIRAKDIALVKDGNVIDPAVKFTDTVDYSGEKYYEIFDTLYFQSNPNHYNIEVDFFIKVDQDNYQEYDWMTDGCDRVNNVGQTYDGRFPVLAEKSGTLEGTLRYTMNSYGFSNLFSKKTLKLRVKIRDRALHTSNTIDTPDFTLDGIRKH